MEESIFLKYAIQIKKQKNSKEEVIKYIQESTKLILSEDMVNVSKKQITFNVSSIMKHKLFQQNISKLLSEKGYTCRL